MSERRRTGRCEDCGAAIYKVSRRCITCHNRTMQAPLEERFWASVDKDAEGGCWLWTGPLNEFGYGALTANGRRTGAHRVALQLAGVEIASGAVVCHRCDNPACVNPSHLYVGTQAENIADMHRRGRARPQTGDLNPHVKLSDADVAEIRRLATGRRGESREIAPRFNVHPRTIRRIISDPTYRAVPASIALVTCERCDGVFRDLDFRLSPDGTRSTICKGCERSMARELVEARARRRAEERAAARSICVGCGVRIAPGNRRCWDCEVERRADLRRDRDEQIVAWWSEGLPLKEIAARLGWSMGHLSREMANLRERGADLPKRCVGRPRKRTAA